MALTSEERERIRQEETIRAEVRQQATQHSLPHRALWVRAFNWIWSVSNSNVGGWVLSTVLVGGVAWMYADLWKPRQEKQATIEKLESEIDFRIRLAGIAIEQKIDLAKALDRLNGSLGPVYAEYAERRMPSLLWQLGSLIGAENGTSLQNQAFTIAAYGSTPSSTFPEELAILQGTMDSL